MLAFHKAAIRMHRINPVLKTGSLQFLLTDYNCLGYARFTRSEQIIVLFNNNDEERELKVPVWMAGIILFSLAVLFQLVTLPVEFNASSRALKVLEADGILGTEELAGGKKVLRAAALTYVAALASSILQLLRLIILAGGRRDRD